nr:SpoIIE family protein phosphatase [Candidatus Gracilibacteria bacterium]
MKHNPLFRYSINFKVFSFTGIFLAMSILIMAILIRSGLNHISIYWLFLGLIIIFFSNIILFVYYITFPLEEISKQILALLTGKPYQQIPPIHNDEIGIITHFFNTITEKIRNLKEDLNEGKRMSHELNMAARIQSDVLPKEMPSNIIGIDIVAKARASKEVGGDCFDFINRNDELLIYIGDVTGHGVPAGLVMMLVNTTIRVLAESNIAAKDIIVRTNAVLKKNVSSNHFMSLAMLKWDNIHQKMSYFGAGHEYILHFFFQKKEVIAIKTGGM